MTLKEYIKIIELTDILEDIIYNSSSENGLFPDIELINALNDIKVFCYNSIPPFDPPYTVIK